TPQQAFDQLYQEELPDPLPPIDPLTGREWVYSGTSDANSESFELSRYLNAWMVAQTLATEVDEPLKKPYSFRESIIFFFHTLFTTQQSLVNNSRAIYFQNALFRKYAFDRSDRTIPNIDPELPDDPAFVNLKEL